LRLGGDHPLAVLLADRGCCGVLSRAARDRSWLRNVLFGAADDPFLYWRMVLHNAPDPFMTSSCSSAMGSTRCFRLKIPTR